MIATTHNRLCILGKPGARWVACLWIFLSLQQATGHGEQTSVDAGTRYMDYCSVCHGEKGDGDSLARRGLQPPPRDFTTPESARLITVEYADQIIRKGKPGTAMVGWDTQLDDAQVHALAEYIVNEFVRAPSEPADSGARVYARTCSVCHGEDGRGAVWGRRSLNPPPVNFTTADRNRLTRERMIKSVTQGRKGTAMSAFGSQLNAGEIATVVDYVRRTFMPAATPHSPTRTATTVGMAVLHGEEQVESRTAHDHGQHEHGTGTSSHVQGNAHRGEKMYADNCVDCHGVAGDGNGPRAYFIFPKPRNFLDTSVRANYDRDSLIASISHGVKGREMPAWRHVLTPQQIADIAEYVYANFIVSHHAHGGGHAGHEQETAQ